MDEMLATNRTPVVVDAMVYVMRRCEMSETFADVLFLAGIFAVLLFGCRPRAADAAPPTIHVVSGDPVAEPPGRDDPVPVKKTLP